MKTKLQCIQEAYTKATGLETDDMSLITTAMVFEAMDEWQKEANKFILEQFGEAAQRLSDGRYYLMGVDEDKISVSDCLESFGFGRNGLND